MTPKRGNAMHLMLMRAIPLILAFCLTGLFFTLLWWPILLDPFLEVLRTRLPVFGLAGTGLIVGHGSFLWLWREFRHQSKPDRQPRPWRPKIFTSLLIGLVLGASQVLQQIKVIESNRYLSLSQYLREDVWWVWIAMVVAAMLFFLVLRWDSYLSRKIWDLNRVEPEQ
ncbi:MAG: hypothetical protein GY835_26115 [bacterium]|nr:hypothetical protein [bacterium]